jgi:hypothetical protein
LVQCVMGCSPMRTVRVKFTIEKAMKVQRALGGCGWSMPRPGRLYPRYPLYRGLGGPLGRSGRLQEISPPPPPGFYSPDSPIRSVSLYRQIYPGPPIIRTLDQILLNNNIKEHTISGKRVKQQEKKNTKFQLVERQVRTAVCRQKCVNYRSMLAMMLTTGRYRP